ncbi:hypothetical protein Q8A67_017012 [Cirrhinus molitorella]|uniref:Immunoglobulin V-set domain-containing protein n=1 Tax=Cirrhinus molitorella TaxID=172907 RepID=A0AA88PDZ1_9TELE|nr:hypothetical protein Q8A67_017012 [Cirrhinus molitorella]
MKLHRFFTLITCLALTGAVSAMTVDVKRGQNIILPVKTPEMGDVNRVTLLRHYENGTPVPIFRYCSNNEKKRGCSAIDNNRTSLQLGSENVSVIILDASATDAGTHFVEVIGNSAITETFTVEFTEPSGGQSFTVNPPQDIITVVIFVVMSVLLIIVVTVVIVCKRKKWRKPDSYDCTVDSEVADSQSSVTGADERNTDTSSENPCLPCPK